MSHSRHHSHYQDESTGNDPVGSDYPTYFDDALIWEESQWTLNQPAGQGAIPPGSFMDSEGMIDMTGAFESHANIDIQDFDFTSLTAEMDPRLADSQSPVSNQIVDAGSMMTSSVVAGNFESPPHSFTQPEADLSSAGTSGGSSPGSGSETRKKLRFEEEPFTPLEDDEFVAEDGRLLCNWENCHRAFPGNSYRTKHLRTHFKPVLCPWIGCSHRCAAQKEMCKHNDTHLSPSEREAHQCPQCGERFTRTDNLQRHMREAHDGERRAR